MQYWISFYPGVGGDGFANLLEFSQNITKFNHYEFYVNTNIIIDLNQEKKYWEIDRIVDNLVKFTRPTVDQKYAFRWKFPYRASENKLNPGYLNAVNNNQNVIVTSHDISFDILNQSDCKEIFTKDQVKILLKTRDIQKTWMHSVKKNLLTDTPLTEKNYEIFKNRYLCEVNNNLHKHDEHVYIEDLCNSWDYFSGFCKSLNLNIDKKYFDQYVDMRNGILPKKYSNGTFIKNYKSVININNNYHLSYIEI